MVGHFAAPDTNLPLSGFCTVRKFDDVAHDVVIITTATMIPVIRSDERFILNVVIKVK
jgi:hypothetical protein